MNGLYCLHLYCATFVFMSTDYAKFCGSECLYLLLPVHCDLDRLDRAEHLRLLPSLRPRGNSGTPLGPALAEPGEWQQGIQGTARGEAQLPDQDEMHTHHQGKDCHPESGHLQGGICRGETQPAKNCPPKLESKTLCTILSCLFGLVWKISMLSCTKSKLKLIRKMWTLSKEFANLVRLKTNNSGKSGK